MRRLGRAPHLQWLFTCDECGTPVDADDLVLVRSAGALPEERTFFVHRRCADGFEEHHPDRWTRITTASPDAAWLL